MPLTVLPKREVVCYYYYQDAPGNFFTPWEDRIRSFTPWQVANAVEGLFVEHNLVKSVVHFRRFVTGVQQEGRGHNGLLFFWHRILGRLVVLFQRHKHLELQCEVAHTLVLMEEIWADNSHDFVLHARVFVDSLSYTNSTLRACGARIVRSFSSQQDLVKLGAIKPLYRMICSAQCAKELETAVDTLSRIFERSCKLQFESIAPDPATLVIFLYSSNPKVVKLAALAIEVATVWPSMDAVFQAGVLPQIVELLRQESTQHELSSILQRIVRNIAGGSERHIQALLDYDLLRFLQSVLKSDRCPAIAGEAIANICSGSQHQFQQVIDMGVFQDVVEILRSPRSYNSIRAAVSVLANATNRASSEQMQFFVDLGCVQLLTKPAFNPSVSIAAELALRGLQNFLKFGATQSGGAQPNPIVRLVKEALGNETDFKRWQQKTMPRMKKELHELATAVVELCG